MGRPSDPGRAPEAFAMSFSITAGDAVGLTDKQTTSSASWLQSVRDHWHWRGNQRPPFAHAASRGQESVWDYPRPSVLVNDGREVVVRWGNIAIARTTRAIRVLETAHPPSFYLPWEDVARKYLTSTTGSSRCERKGPACYWSLRDGARSLPRVAWSYPRPLAGAEALAECVAFYPKNLASSVGSSAVTAQPGRFYGGWVTPELVGPFKGGPGTETW
jgi:uncharacterized protein (DUF427 family)